MPPTFMYDVPLDVQHQWLEMTDFSVNDLRRLGNKYNQICIPILDPRFFYERMITEGMAARDAAELDQKAKDRADELTREQYAFSDQMLGDSFYPGKICLTADSAWHVRLACSSYSIQRWITAICSAMYPGGVKMARDGHPNSDHGCSKEEVEEEEEEEEEEEDDGEVDLNFETQDEPYYYQILRNSDGNRHEGRIIQHLGDIAAAEPLPCSKETPPSSCPSSVPQEKLLLDDSASTLASTLSPPDLSAANTSQEKPPTEEVTADNLLHDGKTARTAAAPDACSPSTSRDSAPTAEGAAQANGDELQGEFSDAQQPGSPARRADTDSPAKGKRRRSEDEAPDDNRACKRSRASPERG
ncbi:uncharacterized protein UV8b_07629 [Ustilaginoidea virens]|uniref:Uncharacterized protein n=1 Tax=Ustilaginoidea virens TaxID=1159556 RepID=A0A063BP19_USTVR|nr:uncharacterized protein UV8b_07629 [Ustilaginoidea virens]QUC23388.1 hypothetical protein UV8b_07629 [Ustilaginoidea virens]GAO19641.1 hypothetical protein UVI_02045680 [Ustilaginoidea virens]